MKFQKYLHAIPSSIPFSPHYVSAYLKISLSPQQFNNLNELTTISNLRLFKNLQNLKLGNYDHKSTTFNPIPCAPIKTSIPYQNLIGSQIFPKHLELDSTFPINYNFIGMNIQTNDFHLSLLPIIRFNTQSESESYLKEFKNQLPNFNSTISLQFDNDLVILPKFDYSKFFLTLKICKPNHPLTNLIHNLYNIRLNLPNKGEIIGEYHPNYLLNWAENCIPHMSFGVCNINNGSINNDNINNGNINNGNINNGNINNFGTLELSYLNNVLLDWKNPFHFGVEPIVGKLVFVIDNQHLVYG